MSEAIGPQAMGGGDGDASEAAARLREWMRAERDLPPAYRASGTSAADGGAPVDAVTLAAARSGLEIVEGMLRGEVPQAPIGTTLRFRLVEAAHGHAVFQSAPSVDFANPQETMHGGWLATLLDGALGCAVRTTLPPNRIYTTLDLGVKFVRALTTQVPLVRAEARVVHSSRQTAIAEGRVVDAAGTIYARGSATCLVLEPRR